MKIELCLFAAASAVAAVAAQGNGVLPMNNDRDAVIRVFEENVYGVRPKLDGFVPKAEVVKEERIAEAGAVRKTVAINTMTPIGESTFKATAYFPEGKGAVPVFVMPGFPEPVREFDLAWKGKMPCWPVDLVLSNGFGTVTFDYNDVLKDDAHVFDGVERAPNAWGAISTWALAASRVADWLETEPLADKSRLAVVGLSRLGKTTLWAGATDTRFAMVCPTCSGLFGARMTTRNLGGETIDQITAKFPHWFAPQCRTKWCGKDWELPFDQHWLLGAVAPRLLAVGSAEDDWWACPSAEFCSWECSRGRFHDLKCIDNTTYHVRHGGHGITPEDWKEYIDFAKKHGWQNGAAAAGAALGDKAKAEPVKVIFDTDMLTDYDDAGALACLHALADAGECEILATLSCTRGNSSVAVCEAVNAFYGRPGIPVGCTKEIGFVGEGDAGGDRNGHAKFRAVRDKYARWVRHRDSATAPDALDVYRKVLSSQPDGSVVICSVGFLTNLRRLVEAEPELVAKKVKLWVAMACKYPKGEEYNSSTDAESSAIALEKWPTPIAFSDFDYGRWVFAGRRLVEAEGLEGPVKDVFAMTLPPRAECSDKTYDRAEGHPSWDETAVLYAVRGAGEVFGVERGTYRMPGKGGENVWVPDENGRDLRLTEKMPRKDVGALIDDLMCRPPIGGAFANAAEPPTDVVVAAANSRSFEKKAADFVCTGTNDEATINAAIAQLKFGGTVRLADGDYFLDACTNEGNSAVLFGYNDGITRVVTVKGTTEGKVYGAYRGATLHVTKRAMDAMSADCVYRVFFGAGKIPEGRGDTYTYTHVNNVNFINFRVLFHDASKPLVGIDGRHFGSMELDLVGIYTERYFPDRYEHLKPATPAKGSIGVYSLPGSNDESARSRYNEVNVGGLHTGFVLDEVDHLVMTGCMAARCVYGYWFERGTPKTLTMINCCDEGNAHLPRFRGRGHLTAIDFNAERFNTDYIPDDPDGDAERAAVEEQPGGWSGYISYTLQGTAYGLGSGNWKPARFWRDGDGKNFKTVDHNGVN